MVSKMVYLLDTSSWPNEQLLNLTTDQNGLATFSLCTASLPKAGLSLVVRLDFVIIILNENLSQ